MMRTPTVTIAIALLALAACRSAGTTYYTLVAPATPAVAAPAPAASFQLDVLPVDVPPQVDRAQMVVREGTGQVTPVDTRNWIAPLSAELQRALSNDLTADLGARDVDALGVNAAVPTMRVKMIVQRFESVLGQFAEIDAVWTVQDGGDTHLLCGGVARETATVGYEGIAEAHQRALARLAEQIATAVRDVREHGAQASCPNTPGITAGR